MTDFLVLSYEHGLLPVAHRLQRVEGETVHVLVKKKRYERAWSGRFPNTVRGEHGEIQAESLEPLVAQAERGELIVLSDSPWADTVLSNAQRVFGTLELGDGGNWAPSGPLRVGGWWTGEGGGPLLAPHLLVVDQGCWPGGLGPSIPGGLTLARISSPTALALFDQLTKGAVELLQGTKFRGLVQVGLQQGEAGAVAQGMVAGWPWLHTQAFLSELEGFGAVLRGERPPALPSRFVTVLPVTLPPWPNPRPSPPAVGAARVPIGGLTPQQIARVFWQDAEVREGELWTAGLDGLVGIVRGPAESAVLARGRALEIALRMDLPEKQLRPDVGQRVEEVLASLEQTLGVTL